MKNAVNKISRMIVAITLILVIIDCSFSHYYHSNFHIECTTSSMHIEHSQCGCFEEDVFFTNSNLKSNAFRCKLEILPVNSVLLKECYNETIWQPPKLS